VFVVLGHESDRAEREVAGLSCRTLLNRDYESGMHTSFRAGIAAVPTSASAAIVLLPDMPYVSADMVGALIARYRVSAAPLVISEYGGVHAPPTLYDRSLFAEICGMDDGGGRQVVRRHRGEAEAVEWPASWMADLDAPEDVENWRSSDARGKKRPGPWGAF
jgi:molybdenum cofactor cytidylyltransferase